MTSTPRPKRVRKTPEARRAEIVAKAAEIALAEGLEIITLQRVATELGVRPGLIGHYFPVAQDLVDEAFGTAATAELEALLPAAHSGPEGAEPADAKAEDAKPENATPTRRVARFLALTSGEAYDGMSRLWLNARHLARYRPTLRERVELQERDWTARIASVIAEGVATGEFTCPDPKYAAIAILVVMDGLGSSANTGIRSDDPPAVETMLVRMAEQELGLKPGSLSAQQSSIG